MSFKLDTYSGYRFLASGLQCWRNLEILTTKKVLLLEFASEAQMADFMIALNSLRNK